MSVVRAESCSATSANQKQFNVCYKKSTKNRDQILAQIEERIELSRIDLAAKDFISFGPT